MEHQKVRSSDIQEVAAETPKVQKKTNAVSADDFDAAEPPSFCSYLLNKNNRMKLYEVHITETQLVFKRTKVKSVLPLDGFVVRDGQKTREKSKNGGEVEAFGAA